MTEAEVICLMICISIIILAIIGKIEKGDK